MKKPPKEERKETTETPYKLFEGVDYDSIMSLRIPAITIDVKDEQRLLSNDQIHHRKNLEQKRDVTDMSGTKHTTVNSEDSNIDQESHA